MNHEDKTATQLLQELDSLRRRVAELEAQGNQNRQINEELLLFKSIVEASHEAIAISDREGRLLYINPAHEKLFGRSLEEAKELNYRDYYPAESLEELNREVAPALERGESWEGELEVFDAQGRRFTLWERADSVRDADGRMLYGFGFMHDITPHKQIEQRLAEALALNKTIIDTSTLGILAFTSEGQCVFASEAAARIVGGTQEALLRQNFHDLSSWQTSSLLTTALQALASGEEKRHEIHTTSTFGKEIWMDCRFITFTSGGEQHLLLLIDDITGRKVAEAALQEYRAELENRVQERTLELSQTNLELQQEISERRQAEAALKSERDFVAALLDTVGALVVVLDRGGRIVRFNHTCEAATGYRRAEVLGREFWDIFLLPEEREAVAEVFQRLAAGQFPSTYENYWRTKDGGKILISWANTALVGSDGRVDYVIATGIDITASRQAEDALRESEQRYSSLFANNHAIMLLIDPETAAIVDANPAASSFYGFSRTELTAKKITDINTLSTEEVFVEMERARARERQVFHFRHRLADGEIRDVEVYSGPIEVHGRPLLYSIIHDVSDRKRAEEALRESERRLGMLLDNLPGMAYRCANDESWTMEFVSEGGRELTGYDPRALEFNRQRSFADLIHPDDRQMVWDEVQDALARRAPFNLTYRITNAAGEEKWVQEKGQGVFAGTGEILALEGFITDITQGRQAEEALRESEERFRILVDQSFDGIFVHENFSIVEMNQQMADLSGYSCSELLGMRAIGLFTPNSQKRIHGYIGSGRGGYYELELLRKDGRIVLVESFGAPCTFHGRAARIVAVRDISERKRAEEALRESEARFRELAENIREVFWTFDWHSQKVLYASPAYEQVYGRSVQALFDDYHEWDRSIHPDDIAYAQESFRKILETGGGEPREYRIIRPDGSVRWVSDRGFAIRGPDGSIGRIVGIAEDITARKLAEEHLKAAEAEKALVLNSISELVVFYDADMRLQWANRAVEEALATPLEGLIGRHCYEIWHGRTAFCEGCLAITSMASGESQQGEMTFPDGKSWLISGTPVQDPEGRVVGVVETALDITARKQAEEALRQSEERFRAIFDRVSVGMALVDADGGVLMANDADCRFLGYPREELLGLHFSVFTHPDDLAIDAELYEGLLRGERESYVIDKRYIRKDGGIVWGRLSVSLVRDEQGLPRYTVIACEDITEQRLAEEALKRSQRQLKAILDNIPDLAWLKDRDSRFIAVNEPFGQACGVRPEDLVGRTDLDIWPRELAEGYRSNDREVMESGKRKQVEEPLAAKDSRAAWIETIKTPIYDEQGEVIGTTGIARDITDRRIAQEALKASEEQYRLLVKSIPAVVFKGYADWSVDFFDNKIEELTDYPKADFDSRRLKWSDVVFPEDLPTLKEATKQALEATGSYVREYRIRNKAGKIRWLQARAQIIGAAPGKIDYISGVFFDITAQKELEAELRGYRDHLEKLVAERTLALKLADEQLRESEVRFRKIFLESPIGIGLRDLEGFFLESNPALERILGYSGEELRRLSFDQLIHPDDEPRREKLSQDLMENRRDFYSAEFRFFHKDGSLRWNHVHASLIHDANRYPLYYLAMVQDITREKQAEADIAAYQENLRSLASELSLTEERERRRLAEFLHDDVGQALALAKIKLGELNQEVAGPGGFKTIDQMRGFLEQAIRSTRDLTFELSLPILYETGLEEAVEWLAEQFQNQHQLAITVSRDGQPKPLSEGARVILFRLVRELLTNVAKHAQARQAWISLTREGDYLRIHLKDDGIGFDVTQRPPLSPSATGFGLFSVRERLSHLGGLMEVHSAQGQGTEITISVPLEDTKTFPPVW